MFLKSRTIMSEKSRVFGNNVKYFLFQKGISTEEMGAALGYTDYEVQKIMDARIFVDRHEKREISDFLGESMESLCLMRDVEDYIEAGCIECRGKFDNPENKKLILDILDLYCDMQEAIVEEAE